MVNFILQPHPSYCLVQYTAVAMMTFHMDLQLPVTLFYRLQYGKFHAASGDKREFSISLALCRVEKQVAADSKEALQFLKSQSGQSEESKIPQGGGGERAHGGVLSAVVAGGSGAGSSVVSPAAKSTVAG